MKQILFKKIITISCLFATLTLPSITLAQSNADINVTDKLVTEETQSVMIKNELMAKLNRFEHLSGKFSQQVFDADGNELQTGTGNLSISKPSKVRWETQTPDESLIVSDGKTLWVYDPFIEQVSAYDLQNSIANTPILLLTSQSPALWENYTVNAGSANNFIIRSNDNNSQVKTLELNFSLDGKLTGFNILDATGQLSKIALQDIDDRTEPDKSLFTFPLPDGVHLDDQR